MSDHSEAIRQLLSAGPLPAGQLVQRLGVSQPTSSRALAAMGEQIVRIGAARSIHYALRDTARGLPEVLVYRVDGGGKIKSLGVLVAVRPQGFVMRYADGACVHSDSLPWWLMDMRPQGYLGRAWAAHHGNRLDLPPSLSDWSDTHVMQALLTHGHDLTGNLLLGDAARSHFLNEPQATPIAVRDRGQAYARLALQASRGEAPGSSAGGEQPKFTTCVETEAGPRHVIVKFSEIESSPVSERWRDLLLAEHAALGVLRDAGTAAALTQIVDHDQQRFLQVERFDRVGPLGRHALVSLSALDAEFTGLGSAGWPAIARRLAARKQITQQAASMAGLLWAYGTLIGNTDMHNGNLSFIARQGHPCEAAPAYDMTPMAFAPRSGGGLPDTLPHAAIRADVGNAVWRQALGMAREFLGRLRAQDGLSHRFAPCVAALQRHVAQAQDRIERLG